MVQKQTEVGWFFWHRSLITNSFLKSGLLLGFFIEIFIKKYLRGKKCKFQH